MFLPCKLLMFCSWYYCKYALWIKRKTQKCQSHEVVPNVAKFMWMWDESLSKTWIIPLTKILGYVATATGVSLKTGRRISVLSKTTSWRNIFHAQWELIKKKTQYNNLSSEDGSRVQSWNVTYTHTHAHTQYVRHMKVSNVITVKWMNNYHVFIKFT
jgi:hypothetical protein